MCLGAGDKRELSVLSAQFNCRPNAQKNKARLENKRHTLNIKTEIDQKWMEKDIPCK